MNVTRNVRGLWTTLLLLAGAFAAGCASTATFHGADPVALAKALQLPGDRGRWVAPDRYEFNFVTQYVTFQELGHGRTRVEVICQTKEVAPFAFGARQEELEKAYLASAVETIQRTGKAHLLRRGCLTDKTYANVRPVAVRPLADGDEVLLRGADEGLVLSHIRQGLYSFAALRGSAGGGFTDVPHGITFDFIASQTLMGKFPAAHYALSCRCDKQGLWLKLSAGPDPKAPNGHDADMLRSLTAYVLLKVPTAHVIPPK
ncbi:MAG: hypothetical protein NT031_09045 [Planctomycetota bacterium]|nr:hypothetical protein [Planctomycetota bacterium]